MVIMMVVMTARMVVIVMIMVMMMLMLMVVVMAVMMLMIMIVVMAVMMLMIVVMVVMMLMISLKLCHHLIHQGLLPLDHLQDLPSRDLIPGCGNDRGLRVQLLDLMDRQL